MKLLSTIQCIVDFSFIPPTIGPIVCVGDAETLPVGGVPMEKKCLHVIITRTLIILD